MVCFCESDCALFCFKKVNAMLHVVAQGDLDILKDYLCHEFSTRDSCAEYKELLPGNNLYGKLMNKAVRVVHRLALGTSISEPKIRAGEIWNKLKVIFIWICCIFLLRVYGCEFYYEFI